MSITDYRSRPTLSRSENRLGGSGRRPGRLEGRAGRVSAFIIMIVFAIYFLTPLWWLIVASTKTRSGMTSTAGLWFSGHFDLLSNLTGLFTVRNGIFARWLLNSLLYAGVGGLVATLISAMMGYALAKLPIGGREALFTTILAGVLVPATALALPLFLLFSSVNLTNTVWAVLIPSLVSPLGVYLSRIAAESSIPDELLEAARLDGSSEVRSFFTIGLRLITPSLVTVFLFQFSQTWNNFFLPLVMLQDDRLFPVTMGMYSWNTQITYAPELQLYIVIGSLIAIVPVIVAFLSLQRYWRAGLADGAVK